MGNLLPAPEDALALSPAQQTVLEAYQLANIDVLVSAFTMLAADGPERGLDFQVPGTPPTWLKLSTLGRPIPAGAARDLLQELPALVKAHAALGSSDLLLTILDGELTYAELLEDEEEP